MKKFLILAATAVVALAACSKVEVNRPEASPISFAPNALMTKALIFPEGNGPDKNAFPVTDSFAVFAFANINGTGVNYATPLMGDVTIKNVNGDWKASAGTYLWPATGTVDFYAYYPATLTASFISDVDPKGVNLTGISLGTTVGDQIDPMVGQTLNQVASSKPKVALVFKHITSQIAATAFDATQTESLRGKITIEKVVFKNMKTTGDYREGTAIGGGLWSNINNNTDFTSFFGSKVLTTTENYLSEGEFSASINNSAAFVVIPDYVVTGTTADQAIEVSYSIAAYTINGFDYPATPTQTVSIPLYNRITNNKFENGKRYIFHLGLSLDGANNEIMFSPEVEGWVTEDVNGITVDVVKATVL